MHFACAFGNNSRVSNISDLKTLLIAKVADLSFDVEKTELLADIDSWYACRVACDSVTSGAVQSYSIGGRSVTRQNVSSYQSTERELYGRIMARLYRAGEIKVDSRFESTNFGIS